MNAPSRGTFAFLLIPIFGALLVLYGTYHGPGLSRDSLRYVRGAENIAHGHGYADVGESGALEFITHWPPLYSMVVAVPITLGLSTTNAVRVVNAFAFFATIWLVGVLVRDLVARPSLAPIAAMLAVALAPSVVHNHLMAWSETIFIPLILAGLLKMLDYAESDRLLDLAIAGVCLGLSALARYAGVAFIAGAAAALVLWDWRARPLRALQGVVLFGAVAGLPMGIWFARNVLATRHTHDRPFQPHGMGVEQIRAGVDATSQWLLPNWFNLRVRTVWMLLVVALLVIAWRRAAPKFAPDPVLRRFLVLVVMCVASYLGFILVTMWFFDFEVNFDVRMMAPVFVLVVLAFAAAAPVRFVHPWRGETRLFAGALALSVVMLAGYSVAHAWAAHREPAQFASPRWTDAAGWDTVRSLPPETPIYSSQSEVSQYFTGRGVRELPARGTLPGPAYVLHYPRLDDAAASLARMGELRARVVNASDVVVVYAVGR